MCIRDRAYSESLLYSGYQDLNLTKIFMSGIFIFLLYTSWGMEVIHNAKEKQQLDTRIYAYDEAVLPKLKVLKGELDLQKFAQGGYVLLTDIIGDYTDVYKRQVL